MTTARKLAFDVLCGIEKSGQYSNIAIDRAIEKSDLGDADRRLFTALVLGVSERKITLDFIIDSLAKSPEKIDKKIRIILRLGIYQLAFTDKIPQYAAINETVNLATKNLRGFVNAILRSFLRKKEEIFLKIEETCKKTAEKATENLICEDDAVRYLSVKYSFPQELCRRFLGLFGIERVEKIFEKYNEAPPLTLRINTLKTSREEYARELEKRKISFELTENSPYGIRVFGVPFSGLPFFEEGYFFVQDEASQICVEAIGVKPGDVAIDCCACPGSKTFGMAINMQNAGKIYSRDLHKSKLSLILQGANRLGTGIIEVSQRDAREPDEELFGSADALLCDAPCSGLGVIAKKPEIRYKDLSESDKLPQIQSDILDVVCRYVKCGGVLIYSTCTVLPSENEEVIGKFLETHPEFEAEDFCVGKIKSRCGMVTLYPDIHGTDGFFVAKVKRKAE